jgi:hypothetical protein
MTLNFVPIRMIKVQDIKMNLCNKFLYVSTQMPISIRRGRRTTISFKVVSQNYSYIRRRMTETKGFFTSCLCSAIATYFAGIGGIYLYLEEYNLLLYGIAGLTSGLVRHIL